MNSHKLFACCCLLWFFSTDVLSRESAQRPLELLTAVNAARAAPDTCNLRRDFHALSWNEKLATAAAEHARYLHSIQRLKHTDRNGRRLGKRITRTNYAWQFVAENLAITTKEASEVVLLWRKSSAHKQNLCSEKYTEMAGAYHNGVWVLIFAKPKAH